MYTADKYCLKNLICCYFVFSSNTDSWDCVNKEFLSKYKPQDCTEQNECWMTIDDFCTCFSGVVICSSTDPYRGFDHDKARRYSEGVHAEDEFFKSAVSESCGTPTQFVYLGSGEKEGAVSPKEKSHLRIPRNKFKRNSVEIVVSEKNTTVKADAVLKETTSDDILGSLTRQGGSATDSSSGSGQPSTARSSSRRNSSSRFARVRLNGRSEYSSMPVITRATMASAKHAANSRTTPNAGSLGRHCSQPSSSHRNSRESLARVSASSLSNVSTYSTFSTVSDTESTFSASEIQITVTNNDKTEDDIRRSSNSESREDLFSPSIRPVSAPVGCSTLRKVNSYHSLDSRTSIFESRVDNFRSRGGWKEILIQFGNWTREYSDGGAHYKPSAVPTFDSFTKFVSSPV